MNPIVIAIAGGTGSGKSYLTKKLVSTYPKNKILCEPLMSKRNLYNTSPVKGKSAHSKVSRIYMNFLQYSDGKNDLFSISKLIKLSFNETKNCSKILKKYRLIEY